MSFSILLWVGYVYFCRKFLKLKKIKEFQLAQIKNVQNDEKSIKIPIIGKKECLIQIKLGYLGVLSFGIATLDTGAQASCVSKEFLVKLFGDQNFLFTPCATKLVGPENQQLDCLGTIDLFITLGHKTINERFYCLDKGNCCLIGLPCIRELTLMIFPAQNYCLQDFCLNSNNSDPVHTGILNLKSIELEILEDDHSCNYFIFVVKRMSNYFDRLKQEIIEITLKIG